MPHAAASGDFIIDRLEGSTLASDEQVFLLTGWNTLG